MKIEIKFRIYHPRRNIMIFPEELTFRNSFKEWIESQRTDGIGFSTYDSLNDILMQYVGLKDKNNVEIYVGDIVDICRHGNEENIYQVEIKDIRSLPPELFGSNFTWCEVVGNIYKNLKT